MSDQHLRDVQPLGRALHRADAAIEALMASRIEAAGISFGQVRALNHLCNGLATTAGGLSLAMRLTTGATTRLIDGLEGHGWLNRERRQDDRRIVELCVTDDGKAMVATVMPIVVQAWHEVLSGLEPGGIEALQVQLLHIARLADELRAAAGKAA